MEAKNGAADRGRARYDFAQGQPVPGHGSSAHRAIEESALTRKEASSTPRGSGSSDRSHKLRAKLRHAALTAAPIWITGGRLAKVRTAGPHIARHVLELPRLPQRLDGLTIAHLSDLHIGKLITPEHLPGIVHTTNRLRPDLIAVTGDFVDLSLNVLDEVIVALLALRAPLGVYLVPGNHDYLDDGPALLDRFLQARLNVLLNETRVIEYHRSRIVLAGIDWAGQRNKRQKLLQQTLTQLPTRHGASDLRLLLAHHPDAFDHAAQADIDLTLSGHTHGGQVALRRAEKNRRALGLGNLAFQYSHGVYRQGSSVLHVTSGVGSWFPLRVRCPAEIALLTLRGG